jgi:hypothetical protein
VAAFSFTVDKVAAMHGVQRVAVRGACCICIAGLEGAVPASIPMATGSPDQRSDPVTRDQATRLLAFAAELYSSLATLAARDGDGREGSTTTRMGVATGEVSFLFGSAAASSAAAPFARVRGSAIDIAGGAGDAGHCVRAPVDGGQVGRGDSPAAAAVGGVGVRKGVLAAGGCVRRHCTTARRRPSSRLRVPSRRSPL